MNNWIKITAFFVLVVLPACMLGPDFQQPVVDTPEDYRFEIQAEEIQGDLRWWELFDDAVLHTLVKTALQENRNVLIAASRIEEARAAMGFTKADIYPRIDIEALAERGNLAGASKTDSANNIFYIAPVLNWEIDFWGKFRRANEAAVAELLASQYSLRTIQIGLIAEVVSAYFLLMDYNQRLDISRRTLESRLESLDIIQKRFDYGIIPELDLNQAQIQKAIAATAIPIHVRLIAQTENAMNILLGRLPADIEPMKDLREVDIPPEIPSGLPSTLLERRPDINQAQYLVQAQNARIGVAEALRLPAISLTGILGLASPELSELTSGDPAWSISGSLFGPLFNAGKNKRRVEIEQERTKQAVYSYENTVLQAFREVEDSLVGVQTYKDQIAAVESKLTAAQNAASLSAERYDKGVTSYLEVLDTQRTLFNVELERSEVKQQFLTAYVKLYKALGGGWLSPEEMGKAQDQEGQEKE
jgi:multidrug efflux system outer membrane protein